MKRTSLRAPTRLAALAALASLLAAAPARAADPVAEVEKQLGSRSFADRVAAVDRLRALAPEHGKRVEKALLGALGDDDWGVQIRAAQALGDVGSDPARDALAKVAVEGEIQWVRDAAVGALAKLDPEGASDRLLAWSRQVRDEDKKALAVRAAGPLAGKDHVARFDSYAKDKDPRLAAAAVTAAGLVATRLEGKAREAALDVVRTGLGRRGDRKQFFAYVAAIEALGLQNDDASRAALVAEAAAQSDEDLYAEERVARALADDPQEAVAKALGDAFAAARKPEELRRLARLAARTQLAPARASLEPLLSHKEERVRSAAARALGSGRDAGAAPPLEKALGDPSPYVRLEAVTALARTLAPEAFRALAPRIAKDAVAEVRLQLVVELHDTGDPAAIPELAKLVGDGDWRVASAAAAAIGTLGIASDLPLLEPHTRSGDWRLRAAAFEGLGRLRAAAAIPLLAEGLTDRDPVVRGVCHANLQILSRTKLPPDAAGWREWWAENGATMNIVKRSRRTPAERERDAERDAEAGRYGNQGRVTRAQGVEILQRARILVVTGAWDKVQNVLSHLAIPFTLLRAQELKQAGLNPNQVVLVNCEGNMDEDSRDRVRWFVNVGGYLMATDWALTKTIEPCFPGYVKQYSGSSTGNDVVVVEEGLPGHPFTAGIFDGVPALKWWLEIRAFPMTVSWPERVEILVDSAEMKQRYGSSPMAVTFRWGLGKVQHSLSHFYLQEEGMQQARKPRDRMVFMADNLGLSLEQIRELAAAGALEKGLDEATMKQIAPDYSMFRMIVNLVREKSVWVEEL